MKRWVSFKQNYEVLVRFLLPYVIILLIPLLIGILAYDETIRLVERDAREANLSLLEQTKDILDRRFDEIDSMVTQISNSSKINRMTRVAGPLKGTDAFVVYDILRDLPYYTVRNNFITDFYIFFKNSDMIISSSSAYVRLPVCYEGSFRFGNMTYEQWHREILERNHYKEYLPSSPVMHGGEIGPVITYLQSFPVEYPNHSNEGNILVLINENEINKLLSRLNIDDGGWAYIADNRGTIITCITGNQNELSSIDLNLKQSKGFKELSLYGERMNVSYTTSAYNGWTYVAALPDRVVIASANQVKRTIYVFMFLSLLVGLLIAFFLAHRNSRPLQRVVAMLRELIDGDNDSARGGYAYLQSSVSKLIENNNSLKDAMQKQIPVIEAAFFQRLLKGEFFSLNEMEAVLAQTDIKMRGSRFGVALLRIKGFHGLITKDILKELNMTAVVIKDIISRMDHNNLHVHSISDDKIALIIGFEPGAGRECATETESMLRQINSELVSYYGIKVTMAVGNSYDSPLLVGQSFSEAQQALDYIAAENDGDIYWYSRLPGDSKMYYYPMDVETRLINLVKAGDRHGSESLLQEVRRKNFEERKLSKEMVRQMTYELRGTVIKTADQITVGDRTKLEDIKKSLGRPLQSENPDTCFESLSGSCGHICDVINEQKKSRNADLINKITDYLTGEYADADLCLCKVASRFGISEVYLCQFFKEKTGENFSDYIERMRIQQACNLLAATDLSINEIAAKTGYNSAHAFRRALKRVKGLNPLDYRDLSRNGEYIS